MFTGGQDWGIPPLHPQRTRELGHRYTIAYLRHHMRHAGLLRVDHVMGLHRLYWTPRGMSAADGLYVRYPANELYAILCLESRRHRCGLVGENLGIVPWYVNEALAGHGMQSMHVMQYALSPDPQGRPAVPAVDSVASLNTHDIFPFEGFRLARDVDDRLDLRLLDEEGARRERGWREGLMRALAAFLEREGRLRGRVEEGALVRGCLEHLAAGPARTVLVNLEDLWLETDPQNVPGTWQERPNWLRRARRSFEAFRDAPDVVGPLREVNRLLRHHEDR
jgi:4-alpha-glucanotransferase